MQSPASAEPFMMAVLPQLAEQQRLALCVNGSAWRLDIVFTLDEALLRAERDKPSVILLDRDLSNADWRVAVHKFCKLRPAPSVLLASPVADQYLWDELVTNGGYEVVVKPFQAGELKRVIASAHAFWKSRLPRG
jgi:DNA-binding response OmpR family regulator